MECEKVESCRGKSERSINALVALLILDAQSGLAAGERVVT